MIVNLICLPTCHDTTRRRSLTVYCAPVHPSSRHQRSQRWRRIRPSLTRTDLNPEMSFCYDWWVQGSESDGHPCDRGGDQAWTGRRGTLQAMSILIASHDLKLPIQLDFLQHYSGVNVLIPWKFDTWSDKSSEVVCGWGGNERPANDNDPWSWITVSGVCWNKKLQKKSGVEEDMLDYD